MRIIMIGLAASLTLSAGPAMAATNAPDDQLSLAERADAAAAAAGKGATLSAPSSQANATAAFLLPLRVSNPRIGADLGLHVVDPVLGEEIYAKNADKPMLPASNMKIVTALTALKVLGPNTRMKTDTVVETVGEVILRGGGDTTLGVTGLSQLAKQTATYLRDNSMLPPKKKQAVKVYVDDSLYPAPTAGPGWTGGYQPYVVRPVRPLGRIGIYQNDSAGEAGAVLASGLKAAGIKATYAGHKDATDGAAAAASYSGDTVAAQVRSMMLVSENNIAEMLYRNVAIDRGRTGGWKGGRLAARDTLRELGLDTTGLKLMDGSGVSRSDRLTPRFLTDLLTVALNTKKHPEFASFFDTMPIGGKSGTLSASAGRYTTKPSRCAAGKVFAKTGTLFDTIGLSGYTRGQDDELKVFSALVNSRPQSVSPLSTRQAVDGLVATVNGCWGPTKKTGTPPVVPTTDGPAGATVASVPPVQGTVYGD